MGGHLERLSGPLRIHPAGSRLTARGTVIQTTYEIRHLNELAGLLL
jgi:hypothetical protein